ncbi:hypothetical protein [Eisenbergiella porci]|uniref:hypothetical protein n=1 Tax=Eisenbergiella porci TaxID=2652274 RepID=UPI002A801089|nr:hypothetical protein [Eisenbergiella porci]
MGVVWEPETGIGRLEAPMAYYIIAVNKSTIGCALEKKTLHCGKEALAAKRPRSYERGKYGELDMVSRRF